MALRKLYEGSLKALVPVAVLLELDVLQQVELHGGWCGGGSPAVTDTSYPAVGLTVRQLLTAEARCTVTAPTAGRRNATGRRRIDMLYAFK